MLFSESIFTLARPAKGNEHVQTTELKREKEKRYIHTQTHGISREVGGRK